MTIGRPQGAVWIGKPMDVVIPLSLDAAEASGSLCLEAEVLQGDAAIPDRRVTVSLEPGSAAGGSRMRIRSTVPIEEPVVTVNVRAGCDTKSTRNYVLLADVPVDAATPAVGSPGPRSFSDAAPALPQPAPRALARRAAGDGGSSGPDGVGAPAARRTGPSAPRAQPRS
ncbi:hypothetical protein AB4Z46_05870, partial [Variovorax sp. M-6]